MVSTPTTNGENGRTKNGQFAPGNKGGPGNPHVKWVAEQRRLLRDIVGVEDLRLILMAQMAKAQDGDTTAAKFVFDYVGLRPIEAVDINVSEAPRLGGNAEEVLADIDRIRVELQLEEYRSLKLEDGQ